MGDATRHAGILGIRMDFQGGADADGVSGGTGTDVLRGGGGNDSISDYSSGDDQLFGEDGDDQLWVDRTAPGLATVALLDGGTGDDRLGFRGFSIDDGGDRSHASSRVTMNGGEGADYFYLSDANVAVIDGGPGDDHVAIDLFGDYTITLGPGRDLLELADPRNFFVTERPVAVTDFVTGAGGDRLDLIDYFADLLFGWDPATNPFGTYARVAQQGEDVVLQIDRAGAFDTAGFLTVLTFRSVTVGAFTAENLGGWTQGGGTAAGATLPVTTGDDFLIGLSGDDIVAGSDGADRIRGGAGSDRLEGGEGADVIVGEFGNDELIGGAGNDQLMDRHHGDDTLRGGAGNDLVYVQREAGAVSRLVLDGGDHDDYVSYIGAVGSSAETTLIGGSGNDSIVLNGDQGATIDAGPGDDNVLIYLSKGRFELQLGSGADTVAIGFDSQRDGVAAFIVRDFQGGAGGDLFRLDPTFDGYWTDWDGAASLFKTGHLKLVQQGADTLLQIDRNGGGDGFMDFVTFRGATTGGVSHNMRGSNLAPAAAAPTDGDDTIEGTPGDDVLDGLKGADTIYGRAGNDRLAGGEGNDRLFGEEDNDTLSGGAGDDFLAGGIGNDVLDGGAGTDRAEGGAGDDVYYVDAVADVAYELANEGSDLLITRVGYTLGANIEKMQAALVGGTDPITLTGNALGNTIWATFGANVLDGGAGADVMYGYGGNDTYYVDNAGDVPVEFEGHGTDLVVTSVNFALGANIENIQASFIPGTAALTLAGNALGNTIWGTFGANVLDGGAGADVMYGYGGNDTYYVDNSGDVPVEFEGHGTDLVVTSVNYALSANIENIQASFIPGTAALTLAGNALGNTIWGTFGANVIDGGAGADVMYGYGGNDTYYVDNAGDVAIEFEGHGTDLTVASVNYALSPNVENLQAAFIPGTAALALFGNAVGNTIWGTFGANVIDGGAGADVMYGYGGDDTYYVDNAGDTPVEFEGHGTDLVVTSVSYALSANVENMQSSFIPGTAALTLAGNALGNTLWGNFGDNSIDGGAGADTMYGYGGNDTYYVDNADDRLLEAEGHGTDVVATTVSYVLDPNVENLQAAYIPGTAALSLTGNALGNVIWGNFGNNVIDGGGGADMMYGFGGDDIYYLDNAGDGIGEDAGGGNDTVSTGFSYALGANLENLVATDSVSTAPLALTGNGAANLVSGNAGANVIDGKGGNDSLTGGAGADVFAFTTALDPAGNVDTIADFNAAVDRLRLAVGPGDPFAGLSAGALSAASFYVGPAATSAEHRIVYYAVTGSIYYDVDGAGGAAQVEFARIAPYTDLKISHFDLPGTNGMHTITSPAAVSVVENSPTSQVVYKVTASDPEGDALLFHISSVSEQHFSIDPHTGEVRLLTAADYEAGTNYQLRVYATDSSGQTALRDVTLTVTDVAETGPVYLISEQEPNDSPGSGQIVDRNQMAPNSNPIVPDATLPSATISGTISSATDLDTFRIHLNEGELLILDVDGTDTLDAELRVTFGMLSTEIARNDDPGSFDPGSTAHEGLSHNMDSVIRVRAPSTGTYVFQIASFQEENGSTSQGGYTLHVLVGPVATPAQIDEENIQSLLSGDSWDTLALTYGFTTSGSQYGPGEGVNEIAAGMSALNATQQAATNTILAHYANLTNLTFSELTGSPGSAHMRYALSLDPDTAHAYHPGPGDGGDSWYNTNKYTNPTVGNYQWMTFLHETGHALGLKHGHESPALSPDRDSLEFSVMTYRSYIGASLDDDSGFSNETWGYPQTPMMYDIAALQRLYGADFTFNGGNTVYSWDSNSGVYMVNGAAQWAPGANRIFMTIWDGGGVDTYDATGYGQGQFPQGVHIDLRPGEWTVLSSTQLANLGDGDYARGNVFNALLYNGDPRSLIENAIGGNGGDWLIANAAGNRLTGAGGADVFSWKSADAAGVGARADTITDFVRGVDKIDLEGMDAITATPGNDQFAFIGTAAFSGAAGQLRYEVAGNQVRILGDTNGDGQADFLIGLDNLSFLDSSDFMAI
jgi:Ca2+-binding RTX toxin-like protein